MRRDDLEAASNTMAALDLIDRCSVLALPLLEDRPQTVKAISALLGTVVVLARRLDDQERLAVAMQLVVEARRLAQDWMH
jgi:hypothetical protein